MSTHKDCGREGRSVTDFSELEAKIAEVERAIADPQLGAAGREHLRLYHAKLLAAGETLRRQQNEEDELDTPDEIAEKPRADAVMSSERPCERLRLARRARGN